MCLRKLVSARAGATVLHGTSRAPEKVPVRIMVLTGIVIVRFVGGLM